MRFFDVDGLEMDVQDLDFYIDVEKYTEIKESIEDLLSCSTRIDSTNHATRSGCEMHKSRNIYYSRG